MGKSGHATDLEALAAGVLNAVKFHAAHAATAPNGPAEPPLGETNIAARLNRHDRNMPSEPSSHQDRTSRRWKTLYVF
jgi:hypothetical protein